MKIVTNKMLNEIISKAKNEAWDEMNKERMQERLERHIYELEGRILKLENNGEMPKLEQTDCPWK